MTSDSPTPALTIRDLNIHYGRLAALKQVNLSIPRGQVTAIVGPSGCGKSSFLIALNRLSDLVPGCRVTGHLTLHGDPALEVLARDQDLMALRRRIGMVFQKPEPFPISIQRNFELPLLECGFSREQIATRMESTLRQAGLWEEVRDRLNLSARKLSGGQQQRLCIARALALQPEILLLDEPCSALDPVSSAVVEDHIRSLRGSVTVVIVTHNLAQARRLADRVAVFWMRDGGGALIEEGAAERVFESPQDADARLYLSGVRG